MGGGNWGSEAARRARKVDGRVGKLGAEPVGGMLKGVWSGSGYLPQGGLLTQLGMAAGNLPDVKRKDFSSRLQVLMMHGIRDTTVPPLLGTMSKVAMTTALVNFGVDVESKS